MVNHGKIKKIDGVSRHGFGFIGSILAAGMLVCAPASADAQFTSGSSGTHGAFPPLPQGQATVPTTTYIIWNMRTGTVRYCSHYTEGTGSDQCNSNSTVSLSAQIQNIPAGGLTTGVYEFTDFELTTVSGVNRRVVVVGVSPNVPLSILSQGDIDFLPGATGNTLTLLINGQTPATNTSNFSDVGGAGGPGGFNGGASGNGGSTPEHGAAGFGPAGGAGGRADGQAVNDLTGASAGAPPLNFSLTPLTGGSGGGGGAGVAPNSTICTGVSALGKGGGAGGGGGGALLLAGTGRVNLASNATIVAIGGNGSSNQSAGTCTLMGGGGGGGSVRIVAREFIGAGTINVSPGVRADNGSPAVGGRVRIETALNTFSGSVTGASGGSFLSFPTAALPSNQPLLRITSIGGETAPTSPSASLVTPDITFASPIDAPVSITVAASNVPLGTTVNLRIVPATGQPTTGTTSGLIGTVASSTAAGNVTLPPGAGVVTASASFSIASGGGGGGGGAAALNMPMLIDGRPFERVEVTAQADGSSRAYLIAQNGVRFEFASASR
jgi:hypothetical protein